MIGWSRVFLFFHETASFFFLLKKNIYHINPCANRLLYDATIGCREPKPE